MKQILLEKLTVTQPVRKFPTVKRKKVHYRIHKNPALDLLLTQFSLDFHITLSENSFKYLLNPRSEGS
jgi:hypothetical protein